MSNTSVSAPAAAFGAELDGRTHFLIRTYEYLLIAVIIFIATVALLFQNGMAAKLGQYTAGTHWLLLGLAFVGVAGLGGLAARQAKSTTLQYLTLCVAVIAKAIVFIPILFAIEATATGLIASAPTVALLGYASLACIALGMRRDFSLLHALPVWWVVAGFLLVVARSFYGLAPGVEVAVAGMTVVGSLILWHTATVLQNYPVERPVAAALELFTASALPFLALFYFYQHLQDKPTA